VISADLPAPRSGAARAPAPLDGIRVIDFTSYAAGPYCGLMMGLLGAEVIRVESRQRLDLNRRPHPLYGRLEVPKYDHLSARKRSVTLDLKSDRGNALAKELVAVADLVIENFRPGVMERLGLAWPDIHRINDRVVMISISAYGQEGPYSRRPGYAPIFGAEGGLGYLQGYPDGPPFEVRNQMDHQVGLMGALVALTLLEERDQTGVGSRADLSGCEVAAMLAGESVIAALADPNVPLRLGNDHEIFVPHGVYPTAGHDRWIAIAVRTDAEWARLVELNDSETLRRAEFATTRARLEHRRELDTELATWTADHDGLALAIALQHAGVCADISMSARDLVEDAHLLGRGSLAPIAHPEHGVRLTVQTPWRYERAATEPIEWSPEIGEHNETVICGLLGHSRAQLREWIADGSVH
jgi:crotonobetainyl-CoA:carnitine CoA-transferase CaiB-like acyl-CoA transferase